MHWNVHTYRMLTDERIASLRRDAARQQLARRVRGTERPRHVLAPWIERMHGVGILAWVLRSERTRADWRQARWSATLAPADRRACLP